MPVPDTVLEEIVCPIQTAVAPSVPKPGLTSEKCGGHPWFRTSTMPPGRYSSQDAFDIHTLDPQALDAPDGLCTALSSIEAVCHRGDPDIAAMVAALDSRSHILEYMISGTLRVTVGPCVLPALIVSLSSAGGGGIRETLEMDSCRVSNIRKAKYDGCREYAAPPEALVIVVIRGISIRCRYTSQPPRILEEDGTLVQYPEGP